ncbi:helix-turn-helix domain-containing protein [Achromobacter aloeverae]|uniref:Transcriptional regulator n=1 Tax=Achromobacter aloeverae TaxID=1750518 RepID=A0A4V1MSR6_9BURK|nr:helix-turn-helix domain-containing protein [Achromobacter aloeverae]RXN92970.1 transcriptional regulator [Achromobacter aloeverae]
MTQEAAQPVSETVAQAGSESVGAALRSLRKSKGWSLEEVASRIKFAPRQIDALENEQWSELPKGISLRGLVRSYARLLGADPQAILASLDPSMHAAQPARLVQGPLHSTTGGAHVDEDRGGSSSWGWLIVILVVVAAGLAYAYWQGWLPQHWVPAWLSRQAG